MTSLKRNRMAPGLLLGLGLLFAMPASAAISISDTPLYLTVQVQPNVLVDMSIETPMQGAAYNDHSGSVAGCTGRPSSDPGFVSSTTRIDHEDTGTTTNVDAPTFTISDYDASAQAGSAMTVIVNGATLNNSGAYTGTCTHSNDPNLSGYKYQISGSNVTFCFNNNNARKNQPVSVTHKIYDSSSVPGSGGTSRYWGTCYFKTHKYIGYFDPAKCYDYTSGQFNPVASPTYNIGASATCGGHWSGNYLNWATMTAIDEFRGAMTGGNRGHVTSPSSADSTSSTVLQRANQTLTTSSDWFPIKVIGSNVAPGYVSTSSVTPYGSSSLYLYNHGYQFDVGSDYHANDNTNFYAQVKVCDSTAGLESNCKTYGSSKKPTGLIQNNADKMRFAVTSYLKDDSQSRDGGVLRAKMKATGLQKLDSGIWVSNPNAEWDSNGVFITNPDSADASASGVTKSGVINYINQFGANGYKSHDPVGELYYESLRYFKHLGNTPEYSSGLNATMKDGFPVITSWDDPIQYSCQKNFIVGINDANPWLDKKLPGTYFTCGKAGSTGLPASFLASDCGEPSYADGDINVTTLTNTVGTLEGLNTSWASDGGTWTSGTVSGSNDGVGYVAGVSAGAGSCGTAKTVSALGEVMGTCSYPGKENSYYIAGLAYYANTHDLRSDYDGKQSISTFMIDTQEYSSNPLDGPRNMLWLTGKYGGFIEKGGAAGPDLPGEWDADSDGVPDNYVFASQPEKLVSALNRAFTDILDRVSSASAVATNSTRLSTNTRVFQARFNSGDWTGQLRAYPLNSDGSTGSLVWDASTVMPAAGSRTAITRTSTGTSVSAVWANLGTTNQDYLDTNIAGTDDGLGSARLDWLLGSSSQEERNGGVFRDRPTTVLGDIINSDPFYVGVQNFAYDLAGWTESGSYAAFRTANASRPAMLYVGANDGMLHAFDADTGVERFAYIPNALYPNLSKLTAPNYAHRYYADGSPLVGEAYLSGGWKSVLVSGLNAGGKAVYALNVTSPTTFGAGNVMWEYTDTDLGYTYGQPQIGKLQNGDWVAVFGNGYDSTNHRAVLYVVDLATGSLLRKIDTGVGDATHENGMATPALLDTDGDYLVDTIYAGDLRGNIWRFDVSSASVVQWDSYYTTGSTMDPVFTARNASGDVQPITAPIEIGRPASGLTGGYMIYFGTGSYFQTNDAANVQIQSFYGIYDSGTRITTTDRSELVEQTITSEVVYDPDGTPDNGDESTYRTTSSDSVDYSTKRGWYMDLIVDGGSAEGERVVSAPLLLNEKVIFTTLIPGSDPCSYGGDSWLMQLLATTGSAPDTGVFDVNDDSKFDANDQINGEHVSGQKSKVGIIKTPAVVKSGGTDFLVASGTSGDIQTTKTPGESSRPRSSWKQIQ